MASKPPAVGKSKWPSAARQSAKCSPTKSAQTATEPMHPPPLIYSSAWPGKQKHRSMATYKILYWQEIPSQIKVEDDQDEVSLPLPEHFQERIDELAAQRGLQGSD